MKKKLAALLMALLLLTVPTATRADYVHGYFYYTVSEGSVTITGYSGQESAVTVPAMIGEYPVNGIAAGAFANSPVVTAIYLPDTIMTIEEGAFAPTQQVVFADGAESDEEAAPIGVRDANGNLIAADTEGNLVIVDADGRETVLDDLQDYSVGTDGAGNAVIRNESGKIVSASELEHLIQNDGSDDADPILGRGAYTEDDEATLAVEATAQPQDQSSPKSNTEPPAETAVPAHADAPEGNESSPVGWVLGVAAALTALCAGFRFLVRRKNAEQQRQ